MRILLVESSATNASATSSWLSRSGHEVDVCTDTACAVAQARARARDFAIVDWFLPKTDGIELTRQLKSEAHIPFVAMMSELPQPAARAHAISAGVDVYLLKPCPATTLVAAIRPFEARLPPIVACASPEATRLMGHRAWSSFGELSRSCLQDATNLPLDGRAGAMVDSSAQRIVSSLGMIDIGSQLEVQVSLATTHASGASLVEHMLRFKNADTEMISETLSELCNNLLGQLKVAFATVGGEFTLSVGGPATSAMSTVGDSPFGSRAATLEHGEIGLAVEVVLRPIATHLISSVDLAENMILGEDLRNRSGAMLLPKGSRVTTVVASRIKAQLGLRQIRVATVSHGGR